MQTTEQGADAGGSAHLFAYTVREFDAPDGKKARSWTRIGVAFPHKDGTGFNVELHSLPLDGRIVLFPPNGDDGESTRAEDAPPARAPEPSRNSQRRNR